MRLRKEKLLDIIIYQITEKALDRIVEVDKEYKAALKEQNEAFSRLDQIKVSNDERKIISRAIDENNNCGAIYGVAAYKLGLQDGLRLALELRDMCRRR